MTMRSQSALFAIAAASSSAYPPLLAVAQYDEFGVVGLDKGS